MYFEISGSVSVGSFNLPLAMSLCGSVIIMNVAHQLVAKETF